MRTWKRGPVGLLMATILVCAGGMLVKSETVKRLAFCAPAAHLAGVLSGAPCVKDGDDYRLVGSTVDLTVVPACAAADYFCLMTGFLSLLALWRGFPLRTQFLVLPSAWIVTILINALRLNACWQTDRLAQTLLPPSLWPATHMAVGIVTFLVGMVGVCWVVTYGSRNEHNRT